MSEVSLPPADGAPFHCNLVVERPALVYWDDCNEVATRAYRPDAAAAVRGPLLELRCVTHA